MGRLGLDEHMVNGDPRRRVVFAAPLERGNPPNLHGHFSEKKQA